MKVSQTRQHSFHRTVLVFLCLIAGSCSGPDADTHQSGTPGGAAVVPTSAEGYKEAPMLAKLVAEGKLPPVEERLPKKPVVVQPVERIGKYGGTWRTALRGGDDNAWLLRTIGYENLVRWKPDWTGIVPNVADSFHVSEDAREYTFWLRPGMRWSDGHPFTADDLVFWYEDIFLNQEMTILKPTWLVAGGKPVKLVKIDDYAVKFKFAEPNGLFLQRVATAAGDYLTRFPAHYLKQFHIRYNPNGIQQLIQDAGARDWVNLFQLKGSGVPGTTYDARWQNKELPTLHGWVITAAYGEGPRVVARRNPYYWKVDPRGGQLPYIDRVVYEVGDDIQVLVLKALNGEIDMMDRHIATQQNKAVFVDNMVRGRYHFFETVTSFMNFLVISLNLTHKDPVKREIFQNKDFRIGLSYAINREEIIDLVYYGEGIPHQAAPAPQSPFYNERLATQYTEYSVEKANAHLDRAGYSRWDSDGFRLGPDGKRISFVVEAFTVHTHAIDALELIEGYWRAVGIDMQMKVSDRALVVQRRQSNEHDAMVTGGGGGTFDIFMDPAYYFPHSMGSTFAIAWQYWYNKSPLGEEPPAPAKKQMRLFDEVRATADSERQAELMKQILEIAAEEFYTMGVCIVPKGYGIVRNNFHNVPESMPSGWQYPNPAPTNTCQYFIE